LRSKLCSSIYILLQSNKYDEVKQMLRKIKVIVKVLSLDDKIVELANLGPTKTIFGGFSPRLFQKLNFNALEQLT
jgi:hypothetical protein